MKNNTARTLAWCAAVLLLIGWLMLSSAGAFALFALAALVAAVPAAFGRGTVRVVAVMILLAAVGSTVTGYPGSRQDLEKFKDRARKVSPKG